MLHTGSTRVSFRTVAILVTLLAATLLGPAPIKAMQDFHQWDVYNFMPTGVTAGDEVRLTYHNFTTSDVKGQFALFDANGQDLFAVNKIDATFIVPPGKMAMGIVPSIGILGANQTRAEVTGLVALWHPIKPGSFLGPASVQIVDEITQQTRLMVGTIGPIDLVGAVGPMY